VPTRRRIGRTRGHGAIESTSHASPLCQAPLPTLRGADTRLRIVAMRREKLRSDRHLTGPRAANPSHAMRSLKSLRFPTLASFGKGSCRRPRLRQMQPRAANPSRAMRPLNPLRFPTLASFGKGSCRRPRLRQMQPRAANPSRAMRPLNPLRFPTLASFGKGRCRRFRLRQRHARIGRQRPPARYALPRHGRLQVIRSSFHQDTCAH
jgi:hypothetical protein